MAVDVQHLADENLRSSSGLTFPLVIPLMATTIGLALIHFLLQYRRLAKMGNKIPGPPTLPFLGNALLVLNKTHNRASLHKCQFEVIVFLI